MHASFSSIENGNICKYVPYFLKKKEEEARLTVNLVSKKTNTATFTASKRLTVWTFRALHD